MNYTAERLEQAWMIEVYQISSNSCVQYFVERFYVVENCLMLGLISGETVALAITKDYEVRIRRLKDYEIKRFTELQAAYDKGISDAKKIGESHGI